MSKTQEFDWTFKPDTYWPDFLDRELFLTSIKGKKRRDIAVKILEQPELTEKDKLFLEESLPDKVREDFSREHPAYMGGEYLPNLRGGEIEICNISLASVTWDQISLRAREKGGLIHYELVDEYESEYALPISASKSPLSFKELTEQLWGCSMGTEIQESWLENLWDANYSFGGTREEAENFISLSSWFYPGIAGYYHARFEEWLKG